MIVQSICPYIHPYMHPHIHACMHTHKEVSAWLRNAAGAIKNNKTWRNLRNVSKSKSQDNLTTISSMIVMRIYIYRATNLHLEPILEKFGQVLSVKKILIKLVLSVKKS